LSTGYTKRVRWNVNHPADPDAGTQLIRDRQKLAIADRHHSISAGYEWGQFSSCKLSNVANVIASAKAW
jgi:hypothetical protein